MVSSANEIKVSIIVPVHNAGNKLIKCLDTLVNQTEQNIEIICVVDAPTDGSDELVRKYAQKDSRVKAIYNETNIHIAQSRNRGLQIARGEYVGFSDHDDWRELNMYEELYKKAKEDNAELVISNSFIEKNGKTEISRYSAVNRNDLIRSIILPIMSKKNMNFLSKSVWASIYKRDVLTRNKISFPDRYTYHEEDTLFNLEFILLASKISFIDKAFYHWNSESHTTSNVRNKTYAFTQINMFLAIKDLLAKYSELQHYKEELGLLVSNKVFHFISYYKRLNPDSAKKLAQLAPEYLKYSKIESSQINRKNIKDHLDFLFLRAELMMLNYRINFQQKN